MRMIDGSFPQRSGERCDLPLSCQSNGSCSDAGESCTLRRAWSIMTKSSHSVPLILAEFRRKWLDCLGALSVAAARSTLRLWKMRWHAKLMIQRARALSLQCARPRTTLAAHGISAAHPVVCSAGYHAWCTVVVGAAAEGTQRTRFQLSRLPVSSGSLCIKAGHRRAVFSRAWWRNLLYHVMMH